MVHYIRFLRVPQVKLESNGQVARISAVLTVTTDLGESYYPRNLELIARLAFSAPPFTPIYTWRVTWRKDNRVAKLDLVHRPIALSQDVHLHVSTKATEDSWVDYARIPSILDVYSHNFTLSTNGSAPDYVERRLRLTNTISINITEAVGESIARHVWWAFHTIRWRC